MSAPEWDVPILKLLSIFVSIGINGPKFGNEKRNISWICLNIKIIFKWSADILFIFMLMPENVCKTAEYVYICIFSPNVTDLYAKNAAQSQYCDDFFCPPAQCVAYSVEYFKKRFLQKPKDWHDNWQPQSIKFKNAASVIKVLNLLFVLCKILSDN